MTEKNKKDLKELAKWIFGENNYPIIDIKFN